MRALPGEPALWRRAWTGVPPFGLLPEGTALRHLGGFGYLEAAGCDLRIALASEPTRSMIPATRLSPNRLRASLDPLHVLCALNPSFVFVTSKPAAAGINACSVAEAGMAGATTSS